jgi:predicted transposase YbfD/YdcC
LSRDAPDAEASLLSISEKTNEITAIPDILDHLAETKQLEGALVTIDALGARPPETGGAPRVGVRGAWSFPLLKEQHRHQEKAAAPARFRFT